MVYTRRLKPRPFEPDRPFRNQRGVCWPVRARCGCNRYLAISRGIVILPQVHSLRLKYQPFVRIVLMWQQVLGLREGPGSRSLPMQRERRCHRPWTPHWSVWQQDPRSLVSRASEDGQEVRGICFSARAVGDMLDAGTRSALLASEEGKALQCFCSVFRASDIPNIVPTKKPSVVGK